MPNRIVVVHDDPIFLQQIVTALRADWHDVVGFADPLAALDAVGSASKREVLITRVQFAKGRGNGVALACMARMKVPGAKVLFVARGQYQQISRGLGEFIAMPVSAQQVASKVGEMLPHS
jgi:DNA-binding NtrC family response regulator